MKTALLTLALGLALLACNKSENDPAKTSLAALEKVIALAGYDANETKSDSAAYAALDACCKVPGSHDSN